MLADKGSEVYTISLIVGVCLGSAEVTLDGHTYA